MPRAKQPPAKPEPEQEFVPPFYEATEDLMVGDPEAGAVPVAAFRAGDRVMPHEVRDEWGGKLKLPEQFAGQIEEPAPEPAQEGPRELPSAEEPPVDDTAAEPATDAADAAGKGA